MNREETATVLTMITTHYFQSPTVAERNIDLMIETWTMALADIPLTPYIESALEWWFKNKQWPPQAAELRERAKLQMKHEDEERKNAETLALYRDWKPREALR